MPSVPRSPTTVVIPFLKKVLSEDSGTREAGTLLSAATGDMHMQIDVGRHEGLSREIIDIDIRKFIITCDFFRDSEDPLPLDQHIPFTERSWCVNIGML